MNRSTSFCVVSVVVLADVVDEAVVDEAVVGSVLVAYRAPSRRAIMSLTAFCAAEIAGRR